MRIAQQNKILMKRDKSTGNLSNLTSQNSLRLSSSLDKLKRIDNNQQLFQFQAHTAQNIRNRCFHLYRMRKNSMLITNTNDATLQPIKSVQADSKISQTQNASQLQKQQEQQQIPFFLQDNRPRSKFTQTAISSMQTGDLVTPFQRQFLPLEQKNEFLQIPEIKKQPLVNRELYIKRSRFFQENRMLSTGTQTELSIVQETSQEPLAIIIEVELCNVLAPYELQTEYILTADVCLREKSGTEVSDNIIFCKKVIIPNHNVLQERLEIQQQIQQSQKGVKKTFRICFNKTLDFDSLKKRVYEKSLTNVLCCVALSIKRQKSPIVRSLARINFPLFERDKCVVDQTTIFNIPKGCDQILESIPSPSDCLQKRLVLGKKITKCVKDSKVANTIISLTLVEERESNEVIFLKNPSLVSIGQASTGANEFDFAITTENSFRINAFSSQQIDPQNQNPPVLQSQSLVFDKQGKKISAQFAKKR